jgi:transcriptional regulator with XRE-family HTH domain
MKTKELKKLREKAGLKAAELSRMVGKSNSYIASLELRAEEVPAAMVEPIRAALAGEVATPTPWEFDAEQWQGERLQALSVARKANVSHLCDRIEISRAYFYQCCGNKRRPSQEVCEALAAYLEVDVSYFFGYGDDVGEARSEEVVLVAMKASTYNLFADAMERLEGAPLQRINLPK